MVVWLKNCLFLIICWIESESIREPVHLFSLHSEDESSTVGTFVMKFSWFYSPKVAAMELEPEWLCCTHFTLSTRHRFVSGKPFHRCHLNKSHKAVSSTRGMAVGILHGHTRLIFTSALAWPTPGYRHSAKRKRRENQFGQRAAKGSTLTMARREPICPSCCR